MWRTRKSSLERTHPARKGRTLNARWKRALPGAGSEKVKGRIACNCTLLRLLRFCGSAAAVLQTRERNGRMSARPSPSSSRPRTPRFQCGNTGSNPVGDATCSCGISAGAKGWRRKNLASCRTAARRRKKSRAAGLNASQVPIPSGAFSVKRTRRDSRMSNVQTSGRRAARESYSVPVQDLTDPVPLYEPV
jgi:hypothetical protein